jgi:hypothetical protein
MKNCYRCIVAMRKCCAAAAILQRMQLRQRRQRRLGGEPETDVTAAAARRWRIARLRRSAAAVAVAWLRLLGCVVAAVAWLWRGCGCVAAALENCAASQLCGYGYGCAAAAWRLCGSASAAAKGMCAYDKGNNRENHWHVQFKGA